MKKITGFAIIALLMLGHIACTPNEAQLPVLKAGDLRALVIESIKNPFLKTDTLILDVDWEFCGNSDPDELPVVFDLKLDSDQYKKDLSRHLSLRVISMNDFNKAMDTVLKYRFNNKYPESLWDTCRVNKVAASIRAEQFTPEQVAVYESYVYNNQEKSLKKLFTLKNGKWTFAITDTTSAH